MSRSRRCCGCRAERARLTAGRSVAVCRGPGGQTVLQLRVSQPDGRVDEYALSDDGVPRAYVFAETENGTADGAVERAPRPAASGLTCVDGAHTDVSFEGTVAAQYSAIPAGTAADAAARRVVRAEDTISVSIRGDDMSSGPAPDYVPAAREALARAVRRASTTTSRAQHRPFLALTLTLWRARGLASGRRSNATAKRSRRGGTSGCRPRTCAQSSSRSLPNASTGRCASSSRRQTNLRCVRAILRRGHSGCRPQEPCVLNHAHWALGRAFWKPAHTGVSQGDPRRSRVLPRARTCTRSVRAQRRVPRRPESRRRLDNTLYCTGPGPCDNGRGDTRAPPSRAPSNTPGKRGRGAS